MQKSTFLPVAMSNFIVSVMNLGDKVRIWPKRVDKKKKWLRMVADQSVQYRKPRTLADLSATSIAVLQYIIEVPTTRFQEET